MKYQIFRGMALCLALLLLMPLLPIAAADAGAQTDVILLLRTGKTLGEQAGERGMSTDDFALTPAGEEARQAADAVLDAVSAHAAHLCRDYTETARFAAALLGLAVRVDARDLPALRRAGDTGAAGVEFDVLSPAYYEALGDVLPDAELNIVEKPLGDGSAETTDTPAGAGSVIAVIDSGFQLDHRSFVLPENTPTALWGEALNARLALTGKPDAACSEKIPFAYNYAGGEMAANAAHGTRVAALAAGYTGTAYNGEAPGAQLLCMKVFGDSLAAGAHEIAILSAMEDALLLGADVINLSLGAAAGERGAGEALARAVDGAQAAGTVVVCAVGNHGESGEASLFYGLTGQPLYPTEYPARGTVNTPASLGGTVAVGAATGSFSSTLYLLDGEGKKIPYVDSCDEFFLLPDGGTASFAALLGKRTFAYLAIPGKGEPADYAGLDLTGKAALVERGVISFADKAAAAAEAGAIALIVYDNDPETDGAIQMELTGAPIPAVMLDIADGKRLAEAGEGELTIPEADPTLRGMTAGGMADFSSHGMREDFTLAPSLVALGDNFVGLDVNYSPARLSGTSYAAAQVSGATAALLRRVRDEGLANAAGAAEMAALLLQNTAAPLRTEGVPVSVREQGAGVLNTAAAMTSPLLLRGNDGGAVTLTGAEQSFTLAFTVQNLTDHPIRFTLTGEVWGDAYTRPDLTVYSQNPGVESTLTALGYDLAAAPLCTTGELETVDAALTLGENTLGPDGAVLALAPRATAEYRITVTLTDEEYAARRAAFPNGFTLEGRFTLDVTENPLGSARALTLPWAAFCGDWSATPLLGGTPYDGVPQLYAGQAVTLPTLSGDHPVLGDPTPEVFLQNEVIDPALCTFNPNYLTEPMYIMLFPLRQIAAWQVSVTDSAGAEVYARRGGPLARTYSMNGASVGARVPLWDGCAGDNPEYICPDGEYRITLTLQGAAGGEHTLEIPVVIDTVAPTLDGASFRTEGDLFLLELDLQDNRFIRWVTVSDRNGGKEILSPRLPEEDPDGKVTVLCDGNLFYRQYLYVTVTDYAFNQKVFRIDRDRLFKEWAE